jgi:hypothetical protein
MRGSSLLFAVRAPPWPALLELGPDMPLPAGLLGRRLAGLQDLDTHMGSTLSPAVKALLGMGYDLNNAVCTRTHVVWPRRLVSQLACISLRDLAERPTAAAVMRLPLLMSHVHLSVCEHPHLVFVHYVDRVLAVGLVPIMRVLGCVPVASDAVLMGRSEMMVLDMTRAQVVVHRLPDLARLMRWSRDRHAKFPAAFRAAVSVLVRGIYSGGSVLHRLPHDVLDEIVAHLAFQWLPDLT